MLKKQDLCISNYKIASKFWGEKTQDVQIQNNSVSNDTKHGPPFFLLDSTFKMQNSSK